MVRLIDPLTSIRRFLYLVTPNETSHPTIESTPKYLDEALPYFFILITLEYLLAKKSNKPRLNDAISSISAGIHSQLPLIAMRGIELTTYIWVYSNYCLYELAWNNPWTWFLGFLGVDLAYYWLHRIQHEVSFFWSGHQVHHSSEAYNLTTALRQSVFQRFFSWIYYLPMALFVPPSIFLVHIQFNLIYQFWIHTEVIKTLGPLEWIMNTPSHHRVHHGRNPYCIDKNYGGTLIIFDRIFGTFVQEKFDEKLAYGLVHPLDSFDPFKIQLCHLQYLWTHVKKQETFKDKVKALLCGPGWDKGKERLGDPNDLPEIPQDQDNLIVYNPEQDNAVKTYCLIHFPSVIIFFALFLESKAILTIMMKLLGSFFVILSLTVFGNILDKRTMLKGLCLEFIRLTFMASLTIYTHFTIATASTSTTNSLLPKSISEKSATVLYVVYFVELLVACSFLFWAAYFMIKRSSKKKNK